MKALLLALLSPLIVSAMPVPAALADMPSIVPLVDCVSSRGSAVRIGATLLVTAKHVLVHNTCTVNGKPITIVYSSPDSDFAMIRAAEPGPFVPVDCNGFVRGRKYLAVGHARGLYELTTIPLIGTGKWNAGFAQLWGIFTVIPGQSGGAMLDYETGKLVGIINYFDSYPGISGSVQMKDTPICGAKA